ncbi:MAG: hypothetical protein ACM3ML_22915 [Micromonosporaceae bacterium]
MPIDGHFGTNIQEPAALKLPALLSRGDALGFLAILLGATGAVYFGFALADGRAREFGIECAAVLLIGTVLQETAGQAISAAGNLFPGQVGSAGQGVAR